MLSILENSIPFTFNPTIISACGQFIWKRNENDDCSDLRISFNCTGNILLYCPNNTRCAVAFYASGSHACVELNRTTLYNTDFLNMHILTLVWVDAFINSLIYWFDKCVYSLVHLFLPSCFLYMIMISLEYV